MSDGNGNRMTKVVRARVTPREYEIAYQRADEMDKNVSDYVRYLIHHDFEKTLDEKILEDIAKHRRTSTSQCLRDLIHEAQEKMLSEQLSASKGKR